MPTNVPPQYREAEERFRQANLVVHAMIVWLLGKRGQLASRIQLADEFPITRLAFHLCDEQVGHEILIGNSVQSGHFADACDASRTVF